MAAKREHAKATCPFCTWCRRSFYLPDHLMTQHADKIHIRPVTSDHCMHAYVLNKKEEIGFCACFTCGKGIVGDGVNGNGSRWVEMHAKSEGCKKAHKQHLAEFKQNIGTVNTPQTVIVQAPMSNNVSALWEKLKAMPKLSPFMKEIEAACQECFDNDPDNQGSFVFDSAEGFERTVRTAIGDRKATLKLNNDKTQMESSYESELIEMRDEIRKLNIQVNNLLADNKQLNQRVNMLERENGRYKAAYPPLSDDPQ